MTMKSGDIASRVRAVSSSVSPLAKLEVEAEKLIVSAESRFSASSNELRVRVDEPSTTPQTGSYLETRFYRLTEKGWQRTAPRTEFWGKMSAAETTYFAVTYWQRDTEAVAEVLAYVYQLKGKTMPVPKRAA